MNGKIAKLGKRSKTYCQHGETIPTTTDRLSLKNMERYDQGKLVDFWKCNYGNRLIRII